MTLPCRRDDAARSPGRRPAGLRALLWGSQAAATPCRDLPLGITLLSVCGCALVGLAVALCSRQPAAK